MAILIVAVFLAVWPQAPGRMPALGAPARIVVAASLLDSDSICDEANRCVPVRVLRDLLAELAGETETEAERLARENVNLQEQLARTLAQVADLDAQLGPLRAREHAAQIRQQREALKATAEQARPGYLYDPVTGTRTKKLTPQSPK